MADSNQQSRALLRETVEALARSTRALEEVTPLLRELKREADSDERRVQRRITLAREFAKPAMKHTLELCGVLLTIVTPWLLGVVGWYLGYVQIGGP